MSKEELIEKLKPYMYCYVGSGMLTNDYNEKTALSFANSCADIAEEYAEQEKKKVAEALKNIQNLLSGEPSEENAKDAYLIATDTLKLFNQQK